MASRLLCNRSSAGRMRIKRLPHSSGIQENNGYEAASSLKEMLVSAIEFST